MGILDWIKDHLFGYNRCPRCGSTKLVFIISEEHRATCYGVQGIMFSSSPELIDKHFCQKCAWYDKEVPL